MPVPVLSGRIYIKAMTKLFKLDMVGTAANFEQRHSGTASGRNEE